MKTVDKGKMTKDMRGLVGAIGAKAFAENSEKARLETVEKGKTTKDMMGLVGAIRARAFAEN